MKQLSEKINKRAAVAVIATCLMIILQGCKFPASNIKASASQASNQNDCNSSIDNAMVILTDENNGQGVTLNQGKTLQVRLASNPGIGYGWQLVKNNENILQSIGNPVLEPPQNSPEGNTINQVFRFQAESVGTNILELHYQRPREANRTPEKIYRLTVQMSNNSATTRVTESDNNREVRLVTGDTLQVRLPTNSSAGYGWQVITNNPDELKLLGNPIIEKVTDSQLGSNEYQVFRFQVQSAGSSVLELQYRRGGQTTNTPEKAYRVYTQTLTEDAVIRLTESDNDAEIRVIPGNTLIIRLATNPSTGYVWQVAQNNAELLMPLGNPVLEEVGTQDQIFCFQGQSIGSTVLEFQYRRPWEKNQPPLNIYRLNLQIR
jgi:inhibitor of cysteine peptidase